MTSTPPFQPAPPAAAWVGPPGPPGPTGDQGPVGPTGATGAQGATGATGSVTNPLAQNLTFNPDATYDVGTGAARPRNVLAAGAAATGVKAGSPVDADVTNPVDGMLRVDSTNNRLYIRVGGVWRYATLT